MLDSRFDNKQLSREELSEEIYSKLQKAYFNARTDVVAEKNGVVPRGGKHVPVVLGFMLDDIMEMIDNYMEVIDVRDNNRGNHGVNRLESSAES